MLRGTEVEVESGGGVSGHLSTTVAIGLSLCGTPRGNCKALAQFCWSLRARLTQHIKVPFMFGEKHPEAPPSVAVSLILPCSARRGQHVLQQ